MTTTSHDLPEPGPRLILALEALAGVRISAERAASRADRWLADAEITRGAYGELLDVLEDLHGDLEVAKAQVESAATDRLW